jgi:hypothetical protein
MQPILQSYATNLPQSGIAMRTSLLFDPGQSTRELTDVTQSVGASESQLQRQLNRARAADLVERAKASIASSAEFASQHSG